MTTKEKAALDVEAIQKRQGIEYRWTRCIAKDPTAILPWAQALRKYGERV